MAVEGNVRQEMEQQREGEDRNRMWVAVGKVRQKGEGGNGMHARNTYGWSGRGRRGWRGNKEGRNDDVTGLEVKGRNVEGCRRTRVNRVMQVWVKGKERKQR